MSKKKVIFTITFPLLAILLLGLFLRVYKFSEFFQFNHEQDLQAWIVRDILVNKHPRLIGQETSVPGLFIGPLYYYLLAIFFPLFNFDPRASIIPITLISLLTIASVYFVLSKLYGKKVGTIGAFIYAVSPAIVFLDRWVVPTQPTLLWTIWFYYVLMKFARGEFEVTPILIILAALIWHIHIAFIPLLVLIPMAFLFGRKSKYKVNKKYLVISVIAALVLLLPLAAFEFRHNFQQVKGFLNINQFREGEARELREGYYKVEVITEYMNRVVWSPLYQNNLKDPSIARIPVTLFIFFGLIYWLYRKDKMSKKEIVLLFSWLLVVFLSQVVNKRIISDYYFNNLLIISVVVFSLFVYQFFSNKEVRKWVMISGLVFLMFGLNKVVTRKVSSREFEDRKEIVEYIARDAIKNNYPCVAINYIGDIPVRYGYRYLFWWKEVDQITSGNDVAVYSIVQPHIVSEKEITFKSGDIGVILPQDPQISDKILCSDPSRQLLPLNGFVN